MTMNQSTAIRLVRFSAALAALLAVLPLGAGEWVYENTVDEMTSRPLKLATLPSDNSLALRFPYHGTNRGWLSVMERGGRKFAIFSVDKGQILCRVGTCKVTIRFDDAQPIEFDARRPSSQVTNGVELEAPEGFISAATKARRMLVQVPLFQEGYQVLRFNATTPLRWGTRPSSKGSPAHR